MGSSPDAEDIAQEVFLKAYAHVKGFRREASFRTWTYGIMLNCVRSHWRHQAKRRDRAHWAAGGGDDPPTGEPAAPDEGPLENLARAETASAVREAIGELKEELRELIVLRDIEGLTYEQLVEALDIPMGTVKSRLSRARNALKERLKAEFAWEVRPQPSP